MVDRGDRIVTGDAPAGGDGTGASPNWLDMARRAYDQATAVLDADLRKRWKRSYDFFHSRHEQGSKYHSPAYAHRSKLFRPKTRAATKQAEAACAAAFFASSDVIDIGAQDPRQDDQVAAAELLKAVMNYRLQHTIPWFLVLQGAFQTARITGVCVSRQSWVYDERRRTVPAQIVDPVSGAAMEVETEEVEVLRDEPDVALIPPENVRIHPQADWRDPAQKSPYLLIRLPMTVEEVRERMSRGDSKTGEAGWKRVSDDLIRRARISASDEKDIRAKSNQVGQSMAETQAPALFDHDMVWVHEVYMRRAGVDHVYWTLGTEALLTDPKPVREVYGSDRRPVVIGYGDLEAFNPFPASKVEQTADLQREANEISNARIDNVKLAIVGRYFVRAGDGINEALLANPVPGSVVTMKDIESSVRWDRAPDVTASSYNEQDRINVDFDEVSGSFSQGSVMTNRKLNETVGGMNLLNASANQLTEYELRVFTETWVEPTLRQLVKLEQRYETDETVLALAAGEAELFTRYGGSPDIDALLSRDLVVRVNVGMGATDPNSRMQRLTAAFGAFYTAMTPMMSTVGPMVLQTRGAQAVANEIFGAAGFRDASRFLDMLEGLQDPEKEELKAQLEDMRRQNDELERRVDDGRADRIADMERERLKADTAVTVAQIREAAQARRAEMQAAQRALMQSRQAAAGGGAGGGFAGA